MQSAKKKDDLTDLVEILDESKPSDKPNNGDVLSSEGETVRLDFAVLYSKLVAFIKNKRNSERKVKVHQSKKSNK